ncbi:STAS domain-containing protein [Kitasatospora sp. NPDC051914]|uniref:STAS domain-containing protein n=1 Tax=Kitasatospora sp. NPDC051914 TaxID=3154945 RepID=UPI00343364A3
MTRPLVPPLRPASPAAPSLRGQSAGRNAPRPRRRGHLTAEGGEDSATAPLLRRALLSELGHCPPGGAVTVDLAALARCSDSGISVLREALSAAAARGIELRFVGAPSAVRHALGLVDVGGWHVAVP